MIHPNELKLILIALTTLIDESHENSKEHGFHDAMASAGHMHIPVRLALIHEEISEALKEYRRTPLNENMPDSFIEELADAVIRIFDLLGFEDVSGEFPGNRFTDILIAKMNINRSRPMMHGGKRI